MENGPKQLGDFEILHELGRGGMGVVYAARQKSLNRRVALKLLSTGLGLSTKAVMRFKREAEAAAKLHHTNIVPIYFTGDEGRVPYYAMELIEGPSLDQVIGQLRNGSDSPSKGELAATDDASSDQPQEVPGWVAATIGLGKPDSSSGVSVSTSVSDSSSSSLASGSGYFDNVAGMMAGVADALAHAHDQGVIHRDMKPSNLLLSSDGRLSVNDFGLARMLEQPGMTVTGEIMGSPMYMSPEQIAAGRIPLDHRTDIYSLGATLYELLTLKPPFTGQQRDQVLSQIIHKEPARPRSINKRIPQDLETICLKAMEKDPDRRYQTADQMAADLRSFVNRHAISARRIGPVERCVRWVKRHRALSAAIACAVVLGIVLLFVAVRSHHNQQQNIAAMKKIKRDQAMHDALMAAMSGDTDTALARIHDAMKHDPPLAWQYMLLGQVDLYKGNNTQALERFEKSVKLDPKSILAQSMLARGYAANGRWNDYMSMVPEIEKLQRDKKGELTPEELMFLSWVFRFSNPDKSLEMVGKAIEARKPFPLARIARANIWTHEAMDQRDKGLANKALEDLNGLENFVDRDLGNNPLLRNSRFESRLALASLYHSEGELDEARKHLHEAEDDLKFLEKEEYRGFFFGNVSKIRYYGFKWELDGRDSDLDAMGRVMRVAGQKGNAGWMVDSYWTAFYRKGGERIEQALNQLGQLSNQDDYVLWAQIVLLMEERTKGDREKTEQIFQKLEAKHAQDSSDNFNILARLFMPGDFEEKVKYVKTRTQGAAKTKPEIQYLDGDNAEEKLNIRAEKSVSEREKMEIYFNLGIWKLAEGNRPKAREYFGKCAESPYFGWSIKHWSQAFVDRMDKSDGWPDWLPAKKEPVEVK